MKGWGRGRGQVVKLDMCIHGNGRVVRHHMGFARVLGCVSAAQLSSSSVPEWKVVLCPFLSILISKIYVFIII